MQRVTWVAPVVETAGTFGRAAKAWDLSDHWITFSDTATLDGIQRFTITLQGRSYRRGGTPVPWREIFRAGDYAFTPGHRWTGSTGDSEYATIVDGMIVDVQDTETLMKDGYETTTTLTCESMQTILARDAVAYWIHFGAAKGFLKARAELPHQDISGRLDKVFQNYLTRVAFTSEIWERDGKTLKDRLAYTLTSLEGAIPPALDLAIAEGTHFGILAQHLDAPLHELYAVTLPSDRVQGARSGAASVTRGEDAAATTLVLRPAPYPFGTLGGGGDTSEWQALPLHDYTLEPARPFGTRSVVKGLSGGHYNFFLVTALNMFLTDRAALSAGLAVHNPTARQFFAHAPLRVASRMVVDDGASDSDLLALIGRLTWRIAGQHNKLEEYLRGSVTVPFAPALLPGERIRVRLPYGDANKRIEAHVRARTHTLRREEGGTTAVTFERGLPPDLYADPSWFVDGLEQVDLKASEAVSIKDGL